MNIILPLLGGLSLFIFGMRIMAEGLQKIAGDRMRKVLEIMTGVPAIGVAVGALVTSIIQSSSGTTVMVVGFVNAGLMTLKQAIGVIMGANIGTTITAQLIAFKLSDYVMPIIAFGFGFYFLSKRRHFKYLGQVILGFGILFLGLGFMKDAMAPLKAYEGFREFIAAFGEYPFVGVLIGLTMTVLIQSSSATIGILMAMASQGLVSLDAAIPVLLGDNIGTCVTALLASVDTNLSARRAAMAHVLFNVSGTVLFLLLLPLFRDFVLAFSPQADVARQIANAHTSFNVLNTLIFLPLVGFLEKLVVKLVPGEEEVIQRGPVYLDERMLGSPSIALSLVTKEVLRMASFCRENIINALDGFFNENMKKINKVYEYEEIIDELEKEITFYMAKISQHSMIPALSEKHSGLLHVVNDFERIGDHAENIANLAEKRVEEKLPFSDQALRELDEMHDYVLLTLDKCLEALEKEDKEISREVVSREEYIDVLERNLRNNHIARLNAGLCYPASGVVFLDIISNFERIGDHSNNVAQIVVDQTPLDVSSSDVDGYVNEKE